MSETSQSRKNRQHFFDEMYTPKRCEFSRSNDQLYDMRGMNSQQRHSLSDVVMFKSITLKYEDVLAMVLLTRMDSSILHKFSNDVVNAIRL